MGGVSSISESNFFAQHSIADSNRVDKEPENLFGVEAGGSLASSGSEGWMA